MKQFINSNFEDKYENTEDLSKIDFADPQQQQEALNKIEDEKNEML